MSQFARYILIAMFLGVLSIPGRVTAQPLTATAYPYVAIDLGTLGGPSSLLDRPARLIVNSGTVLVQADTTARDTDYQAGDWPGFDNNISHASLWRNGKLTDRGALPGNNSRGIFGVNAHGEAVGVSESGPIDPVVGTPATRAVVWKNRKLLKLPTFGGNESFADWINDKGQVVGMATNAVHDNFALDTVGPQGTQARAFLWSRATGMKNLGTLGGPDSAADYVNSRGQVTGVSFTNAKVNAATGKPTEHPFLWTKGKGMRDLGALPGGTVAYPSTDGTAFNNRGEVVGLSYVTGDDVFHPFLWNGTKMLDLGTFGNGVYGAANAINQAGDVVGFAQARLTSACRAFLWKNGAKINLGTVSAQGSSSAFSVNAHDQVVGGECDDPQTGAWLWQNGTMYDLNKLVAPSSLHMTAAYYIDNRGEIAAMGTLANGNQRAVLLIPKGTVR